MMAAKLPMRGHPVFIAQHATATCCRTCLAKWHGIPAGRALDKQERQYLIAVLERWLELEGAGEKREKSGGEKREKREKSACPPLMHALHKKACSRISKTFPDPDGKEMGNTAFLFLKY